MRAAARTATLALLDGYKAANDGALKQTYGARPKSIAVPSAFVDSISESLAYTPAGTQRNPQVVVRIVRGTFSTEDVAESNDALVDGFVNYVVDNRHQAGPTTLILVTSVDDDDGWIPEWMPDALPMYSTLVTLTLEGLVGGVT